MNGRTLVTGATGALGHFVVRQMVDDGNPPVILTGSGDLSLINDVVHQCTVVQSATGDQSFLDDVIRRHEVDRIAHLASPLPASLSTNPPAELPKALAGTLSLLEAASRCGVRRFVYASSKGVYGPITGPYGHPDYRPIDETYPSRPTTLYGIFKVAAESAGCWYAKERGLGFLALRFATTVGPGKLKRHGGATGLHSRLIENALLGLPVRLPAGIDGKMDTIFNGDVARGVIAALDAPTPRHAVFNIGTGQAISIRDFVEAIARQCRGADNVVGPGMTFIDIDAGHCVLSCDRASSELGFSADPDPDRIVRLYIATMQRMGLSPTPT